MKVKPFIKIIFLSSVKTVIFCMQQLLDMGIDQ